jgi:hypothetical protein
VKAEEKAEKRTEKNRRGKSLGPARNWTTVPHFSSPYPCHYADCTTLAPVKKQITVSFRQFILPYEKLNK